MYTQSESFFPNVSEPDHFSTDRERSEIFRAPPFYVDG